MAWTANNLLSLNRLHPRVESTQVAFQFRLSNVYAIPFTISHLDFCELSAFGVPTSSITLHPADFSPCRLVDLVQTCCSRLMLALLLLPVICGAVL